MLRHTCFYTFEGKVLQKFLQLIFNPDSTLNSFKGEHGTFIDTNNTNLYLFINCKWE